MLAHRAAYLSDGLFIAGGWVVGWQAHPTIPTAQFPQPSGSLMVGVFVVAFVVIRLFYAFEEDFAVIHLSGEVVLD